MRSTVVAVLAVLAGAAAPARGEPGADGLRKPVPVEEEETFLLNDWLLDMRLHVRSLSTGAANRGGLSRAAEMPVEGRTWRFIPAVKGRKTNFGTQGMVDLLAVAADAVAEAYPGSVLLVGNIGVKSGGRLTQSKSHQGGRDADVAFFGRDRKKRRATPAHFTAYDASGKGPNGWTLDAPRTWLFVRTLLESEDPRVQWMFMSEGIRQQLLEHARGAGENEELVRRAAEVMHQPTDSSDHSDHIHIRIYCSTFDRLAGCRDYGPQRGRNSADAAFEKELLADLERRARISQGADRAALLRRLAGLAGDRAPAILAEYLCDQSDAVVDAALDGLSQTAPDTVPDRILSLRCRTSPASALRLFSAVHQRRDNRVWKQARVILGSPACLRLDACKGNACSTRASLCALALGTLGHSCLLADGDRLLPYLESKDKSVRAAALEALQTLYATDARHLHHPERKRGAAGSQQGKGSGDPWRAHVARWRNQSWPRYVKEVLAARGYKIGKQLYSTRNVSELVRAAKTEGPLSYSAQVALAKILQVELDRVLTPAQAGQVFGKAVPIKKQ